MSHFRPAADLDLGRGYPRPSSCAKLDAAQRRVGVRARPRRDLPRARATCSGIAPSSCRSRRRRRRAASATRASTSACWYRRDFALVRPTRRQRILLHFGAVDYRATVWVNGAACGEHEGGYTPFAFDITDLLDDGPLQRDRRARGRRSADLAKPRGKQDWQLEPHSIWYPRTTGIWQTVWLERVPADLDRSAALDAEPRALGDRPRGARWPARRASGCGCACGSASATRCSPTTPTRSSPARCTAASRCPTPASTTPATSCSGARTRPP